MKSAVTVLTPNELKGSTRQVNGRWEDEQVTAAGPFRAYEVHRGTRRYLVDLAVFAPGRPKLPYLRELMAIAETLGITEVHARQLASRARKLLCGERRRRVSTEEHRRLGKFELIEHVGTGSFAQSGRPGTRSWAGWWRCMRTLTGRISRPATPMTRWGI